MGDGCGKRAGIPNITRAMAAKPLLNKDYIWDYSTLHIL
jgi:hypothetical protein